MLRKLKEAARLYGHYLSINIRSAMQYKTSFFLTALGQFFVSFNVFLGIYFMFRRFSAVEGFTYSEVLLCFSVVLLEFSLAEMFARGFDLFPAMVRTGSFDQVLVRPRNEILQVLGSKFELTRIGRMLQAVVMFAYGVTHCGVDWNLSKNNNCYFYANRGMRPFLRTVSDLCGAVLFYDGRAGIYECTHGRGEGVREIPCQRLWEKDAACDDLFHSLRAGAVLPAFVSAGQGQPPVPDFCAAFGGLVFAAVLWAVAVWCQALPVERVVKIGLPFGGKLCRLRTKKTYNS